MTELLILLIFNSFYCIGLHAVTRWIEVDNWNGGVVSDNPGSRIIGKLLYKLSYWTRNASDWIKDPLTECPTCMASVHSLYFFIPFCLMVQPELLIGWPIYAITLSGVNTWLSNGISY